jgi:16S rRNA pseudouridine516 synthase
MPESIVSAPTVSARDLVVAAGVISRRKLRRHPQRVHLDDGQALDMDADVMIPSNGLRCTIRGRRFVATLAAPPLLRLHKPTGFVTSRRDDGAPSIFTLVPDEFAQQVEPVGRLDVDTSGLLLFTADGTLQHRLTHPKRAVPRVYEATLDEPLDEGSAEALRRGEVTLRDGVVPTVTGLTCVDDAALRWHVTLTSGRYHEVRRLFAACGAPVETLHRRAYGPVIVDDLANGRIERLTGDAYEAVYACVSLEPPAPSLVVEPAD